MAAKPIERYVKKQIADQGGWSRILQDAWLLWIFLSLGLLAGLLAIRGF